GNGAVQLGTGDEPFGIQMPRVEADWTDVVAPAGRLVPLHQFGQWRAAVAGDAHGRTGHRNPHGLFGPKPQRLLAGLGGPERHEKCDGDLLRVFHPRRQADNSLVGHDTSSLTISGEGTLEAARDYVVGRSPYKSSGSSKPLRSANSVAVEREDDPV